MRLKKRIAYALPAVLLLATAQPIPTYAQKKKKATSSSGQTPVRSRDSLKEATVAVYQTYQPELRPVSKPVFTPTPPPADAEPIPQEYAIAPVAVTQPYYPVDIKPLALERDTTPPPRYGYNKIGAGSRSSFLFESAGTLAKTDEVNLQLFTRHWRQSDEAISGRKYRMTEGVLSADGVIGAGKLSATLDADGKTYGDYGFNERKHSPIDVTRKYFGIGIKSQYQFLQGTVAGLSPLIGFRLFNGPQIGTEKTLTLGLPYERAASEHLTLRIEPQAIITSVGIASKAYNNSVYSLGAAAIVKQNKLYLRAGIRPAYDRTNAFVLLPDVRISYQLIPNKTALTIGWEGDILQNRLEDLTEVNPYLNVYATNQTQARELYGQIEGNIGSRVYFQVRGGNQNWRQLPVFINDTAAMAVPGFLIQTLTTARALRLQAQIRYSMGENLQIGGFSTFSNYKTDDAARVWHMPGVEFGGDFYARLWRKLQFSTTLRIMDFIYARGFSGNEIKLAPVTDLSMNLEYPVLPRWSVWLQANNLLNNRNERFYGYPAISRSVFGGLRLKL